MKKLILMTLSSIMLGQYNFNLEDINPNSSYFGETTGPSLFPNQVTLIYFGHFNWGLCSNRFGELNNFYDQLVLQGFGTKVKLFGVGKDSHIAYVNNWTNQNNSIVSAESYPYQAWNDWSASQRTLFILDKNGTVQYQQNISNGISNSVYDLVEDLISDIDDLVLGDVNQDGVLNVVDIVQVVNMVLGTVAVNDAADINSDNLVNIVDIVSLVNLILNTQE